MEKSYKGKKLLVIGGFYQHYKIVEAAHELGVEVYVTDYLPLEHAPAKQIADKYFMYDINQVDEMVALCKKEHIDGVLCAHSEACTKPYQEICERLRYPCFGTKDQFEILSVKKKFKSFCEEIGVDVIPGYREEMFLDLTNPELEKVEYPLLVKPSISHGSRGQSICHNLDDMQSAIVHAKENSSDDKVIIEKYMGGCKDLQLAYIVINGKAALLRVEDRFCGTKGGRLSNLCIATLTPSHSWSTYVENVTPKVNKLVRELGIVNAPLFLQGFMDGDKCRFYDPGLRLPGNDYDRVFKAATGINISKLLVEFALTGRIEETYYRLLAENPFKQIGSMLFPDVKPGKIKRIIGAEEVIKHPNVVNACIQVKEGDVVGDSYDAKQRLGEIDLLCSSIKELKETISWIQSRLSVLDENGEEMIFDLFDINNLVDYGK